MSGNGRRRPQRPRISVGGAPGPEEAVAIAAALERFLAETAPTAERAEPRSEWQRAALLEGVERAPRADAWGAPPHR